jgi:hypothetical protein
MYSKIYVSRKTKINCNLGRREYYLTKTYGVYLLPYCDPWEISEDAAIHAGGPCHLYLG